MSDTNPGSGDTNPTPDVVKRAKAALDMYRPNATRDHDDRFIGFMRELVPELIAEIERLREEQEILHPAVLYPAVLEQISQHRWSHTYVLQGQVCNCGYNGDHEIHLTMCIIRAIEAMQAES